MIREEDPLKPSTKRISTLGQEALADGIGHPPELEPAKRLRRSWSAANWTGS